MQLPSDNNILNKTLNYDKILSHKVLFFNDLPLHSNFKNRTISRCMTKNLIQKTLIMLFVSRDSYIKSFVSVELFHTGTEHIYMV